MKYLIGIIISLFIIGCEPLSSLQFQPADIIFMNVSDVQILQEKAKIAFDKAELEILNTPNPKPDEILGPNPDVNKCACKGTGVIIHGDKHETPCPFHSRQ